ncbi:MAG: hypothetical protein ACXQTI_00720 [Candidatus Nezhaarchaeales archaeon]
MNNKLWNKLLSKGLRLKSTEAALLFLRILRLLERDEDKGYFMLISFLSALSSRKPGLNELYGMCRAILRSRAKRLNLSFKGESLQAGRSGKSCIKTINVMTPASIIASAADGTVLKNVFTDWNNQGPLAFLREVGVNPNLDVKKAVKVAKRLRLLILASNVTFTWTSKLCEIGEKYGDVLDAAVKPLLISMAVAMNPFNARKAFRGAPALDAARIIAKLYRRMGYKRALVAVSTGPRGLTINCLSNVWSNAIFDVRGKRISRSILDPNDLDLPRARLSDIEAPQSPELAAKRILEVLSGARRDGLSSFIMLNAAGILYASDKVKNIRDGLEACRQAVEEGRAIRKLMNLAKMSGGNASKIKFLLKNM